MISGDYKKCIREHHLQNTSKHLPGSWWNPHFFTSASVGFCPIARRTSPSWWAYIFPSPLLSNKENVSWNSEQQTSVNTSEWMSHIFIYKTTVSAAFIWALLQLTETLIIFAATNFALTLFLLSEVTLLLILKSAMPTLAQICNQRLYSGGILNHLPTNKLVSKVAVLVNSLWDDLHTSQLAYWCLTMHFLEIHCWRVNLSTNRPVCELTSPRLAWTRVGLSVIRLLIFRTKKHKKNLNCGIHTIIRYNIDSVALWRVSNYLQVYCLCPKKWRGHSAKVLQHSFVHVWWIIAIPFLRIKRRTLTRNLVFR